MTTSNADGTEKSWKELLLEKVSNPENSKVESFHKMLMHIMKDQIKQRELQINKIRSEAEDKITNLDMNIDFKTGNIPTLELDVNLSNVVDADSAKKEAESFLLKIMGAEGEIKNLQKQANQISEEANERVEKLEIEIEKLKVLQEKFK